MPETWIIVVTVLAGAAIGLVVGLYVLVPRTDPKLERLRQRPEVEPTSPAMNDVAAHAAVVREAAALMKAGQKIQAVKVYREKTGVSLAEAKAAVERM